MAGSGRQAFQQKLIDKFVNSPKFRIMQKPHVIFVGADPGGGGPSDLAMTAMIHMEGKWIVRLVIHNHANMQQMCFV